MTMSLVSSPQFRAARAILGWSMVDLAQAAQVSVSTIARIEGRRPERAMDGATGAIRVALETAGVRFLDDEGEGAGLRVRPR